MQKILLSVILALFMALALVGLKQAFGPANSANGAVLVADGTGPLPPETGR